MAALSNPEFCLPPEAALPPIKDLRLLRGDWLKSYGVPRLTASAEWQRIRQEKVGIPLGRLNLQTHGFHKKAVAHRTQRHFEACELAGILRSRKRGRNRTLGMTWGLIYGNRILQGQPHNQ